MASKPELDVLAFESPSALEDWLEAHHASSPGIWVKLAKKGAQLPSVAHADVVDAGLCFGWIDGQAKSVDEQYWMIRFTPRTKRSKWSQINCAKAEKLQAQGRMRPAGRAAVEAAKQDGRWERAYASPRNITVPEDLQHRLDESPSAQAAFEQLNAANRYAILVRIHDAKRAETRARRIEKYVTMLEEGRTIY